MGLLINPLGANLRKWSNTIKQPVNCLSVFDNFVGLAPKGLKLCVDNVIVIMEFF